MIYMFKIFKRKKKESNEDKRKRILGLCEEDDYGIMPPPMNAQTAINELSSYLLGDDWYIVDPVNAEQANAIIVYEIEKKYKKHK